jgi:hypothetical protein
MKKPPDNPEFVKFTAAMRHIMGVSKNKIKWDDAAEKRKKRRAKAKAASPDSASSSSSQRS